MALSENEQRLLEQLEAALAADDPKLADTLRGTRTHTMNRRRAALAGLGFVLGIAALVAGMEFGWPLSILGFLVMLASVVVGLSAWRRVEQDRAGSSALRREPGPRPHDDPWRHDSGF